MNHFFAANILDAIELLVYLTFVFVAVPGIIVWSIYAYIQDLRRGNASFVRTTWKGFTQFLKTFWKALWNF